MAICKLSEVKKSKKNGRLYIIYYYKNLNYIGKRYGQIKVCKNCKNKFFISDVAVKKGEGIYCSRKCICEYQKGKNAPGWKGGRYKNNGYIYLRKIDHPNKSSSNSVPEHRLIMEKYIGRYLKTHEVVHHKNNIRDDNRIENLELCLSSHEHRMKHKELGNPNNSYKKRQCYGCKNIYKLNFNNFYRSIHCKYGFIYLCKNCSSKKSKKDWTEKNAISVS